MPRIGVSITKSTSFRGVSQEFSNVYYYEVLSLPDISQADTIIDNLVTDEKTFHSTAVTFVRGRLWSQQGSPATNEMISQKNLSGAGSTTLVAGMDKERAYLFRLRAGNDSRGNPVYLRKWYHSCGAFGGSLNPAQTVLENTGAFSQASKDSGVALMQSIGDANGSPLTPKICSKNGRLPTVGQTWQCHNYLEHRQLGDMWRAQ